MKNELLAAYIEQSKLIADITRSVIGTLKPGDSPLVDVVRRQQETIDKMQETLDRIVTSRFDKPVFRPQRVERDAPPEAMLFDQIDSMPPDPIEAGINNLTADSDAAFLESVGAK